MTRRATPLPARCPTLPDVTWTILFLILILKLPMLYIGAVVYYAIKAEPHRPYEVETLATEELPSPWKPWQSYSYDRRRPRPSHGGPTRRAQRGHRAATTRTHTK